MNRKRTRLSLALVVLATLTLALSWKYMLPNKPSRVANENRTSTDTVSVMTTDSTVRAAIPKSQVQSQAVPTPAREVLFEYEGRPVTVEDLLAGSFDPRGLGIAFSPQEARWMNREGVPIAGHDVLDFYSGLDASTLLGMAQRGDVRAAIAGAEMAWRNASNSTDGVQLTERIGHKLGTELSDSDWQARVVAARRMFERPEWQLMRKLLWQGVVHGSSYAAQRMIRTYSDSFGTCYDASSCNAWALIAWRMGEWNLSLPISFAPNAGQMPELAVPLAYANRIWMNINAARSERGLPPLDLQLHPGFGVWDDFKRGEGEKPEVYAR